MARSGSAVSGEKIIVVIVGLLLTCCLPRHHRGQAKSGPTVPSPAGNRTTRDVGDLRRCEPNAVARSKEILLTLAKGSVTVNDLLEARIELDLDRGCVHPVEIVWVDDRGRVIHKDPLDVDGQFGRQEFVARFWIDRDPGMSIAGRSPVEWHVKVYVDGRVEASAPFSVI